MPKNWKYRLSLVASIIITTPCIYIWFFEHFGGTVKERLFGSLLFTIFSIVVIYFLILVSKDVYRWIIEHK